MTTAKQQVMIQTVTQTVTTKFIEFWHVRSCRIYITNKSDSGEPNANLKVVSFHWKSLARFRRRQVCSWESQHPRAFLGVPVGPCWMLVGVRSMGPNLYMVVSCVCKDFRLGVHVNIRGPWTLTLGTTASVMVCARPPRASGRAAPGGG